MKSDKILKMIPRLESLNEEHLEKIQTAVDACVIVQALKNINIKEIQIKQIS